MTDSVLSDDQIKETVRVHWDQRAATFDEGASHGLLNDAQREAWNERIGAWAGAEPSDTLDVGCGTGFFSLQLAALGHRATGLDVAEEMLARAREKAAAAGLAATYLAGDAENLPFADGSFDLVIERHVMWTLPNPGQALADWSRVLRPGGHLVLVEGEWRDLKAEAEAEADSTEDTKRGYGNPDYDQIRDALPLFGGRPAQELSELALAHGFSRVEVEPLMTAELWVEMPERPRYALHAWV